ncbi:MAG: hypothetical protein EOO00_04205, partial [Chitinophagaceae bacterium]
MSCNCKHKITSQFPCLCDSFVHPEKLKIGMGLTDIPRQIAGFPEFRRAMLFSLRPKTGDLTDKNKHALDFWKARQPDDLGMMLLEMWAYICDSLSFYDKVISQEEYLRTAMRRPSLRKLVALLGYLPGPAVGSTVYLTALADGRSKLKLPEGTAFRSDGFEGGSPQVFELDEQFVIHPLTNKWSVSPPRPSVILNANPQHLLVFPKTEIKTGIPFLLLDLAGNAYTQATWVLSAESYKGQEGKFYRNLALYEHAILPLNYPLQHLELYMPSQSAALWTMTVTGTPPSIDEGSKTIVLSGSHQAIQSGQHIVITRNKECRWYRVTDVREVVRMQTGPRPVVINTISFDTPGISIPVTQLTLDTTLNDSSKKKAGAATWTESNKSELVVHFSMQQPGAIMNDQKTSLAFDDPIRFGEKPEQPIDDFITNDFFLTDKNARAVKINRQLNYGTSSLWPEIKEEWDPELILPVNAFGNIVKATMETIDEPFHKAVAVYRLFAPRSPELQFNQIFGEPSRTNSRYNLTDRQTWQRASDACRLRHPHLLNAEGVVKHATETWFVTDYPEAGTLYDMMHSQTLKIDTGTALRVLKEVALAMQYLHSEKPPVTHRLSMYNVWLDSSRSAMVMLADNFLPADRDTTTDVYHFGKLLLHVLQLVEAPLISIEPHDLQNDLLDPILLIRDCTR